MATAGMSRRTFVGNWSEDIQMREDELNDYHSARADGRLLSQQIKAKKNVHQTRVALEESSGDGVLHAGQLVCLQNGATEGVLSVDLDDALTQRPHQKFAVTTAGANTPQHRNTWCLEPLPHPDDEVWAERGEADVIHYGQRCRILLNPALTGEGRRMYLSSEMLTPSCHSKVTHQQEVSCADHGTSALTWELLYANPEFRFEMAGQPVKCNAIVVFSHRPTGQYLASHKKTQLNDFGPENECFAQKYATDVRAQPLPTTLPQTGSMPSEARITR